jgi:hypothetical protein
MDVKMFEVRDRGTTIPVMAIALIARDEAEQWLLERAGYGTDQILLDARGNPRYIVFASLQGEEVTAECDPHNWTTRSRTIPLAHQHAVQNWDALKSGDVIDVQYLLRETLAPKESERFKERFKYPI